MLKTFLRMAQDNPEALVAVSRDQSRLTIAELSFIAEAMGQVVDSKIVVDALFDLTEHEAPLVREGAALGLYNHLSWPGVADRLKAMAAYDLSPGVRETAAEMLAD